MRSSPCCAGMQPPLAPRDRLAETFPQDASLADLRALAGVLAPAAVDPLEDHEALRRACRKLDEVSAPAARRALGDADSMRWLLPFWRDLARRCAQLPFKAVCEVQHVAPLWLRAREWEAAAQAVATPNSAAAALDGWPRRNGTGRGLQSTWPRIQSRRRPDLHSDREQVSHENRCDRADLPVACSQHRQLGCDRRRRSPYCRRSVPAEV